MNLDLLRDLTPWELSKRIGLREAQIKRLQKDIKVLTKLRDARMAHTVTSAFEPKPKGKV